jgi:hypothetical protein
MPGYPGPAPFRFWGKVRHDNGHWLWTGYINPKGYGYFQSDPTTNPEPAHRVAWRLSGRDLTPGMNIANTCRVRACVNPAHHEEITNKERRLRVLASLKGTSAS